MQGWLGLVLGITALVLVEAFAWWAMSGWRPKVPPPWLRH